MALRQQLNLSSPQNIAIFGYPNAGKSTLFNALTGEQALVANRAGATVDRHEGSFEGISITDLPGLYSLFFDPDEAPLDQSLAFSAIDEGVFDQYIHVMDYRALHPQLYLTLEGLDAGLSIIVLIHHVPEHQHNMLAQTLASLDVPLIMVGDIREDIHIIQCNLRQIIHGMPKAKASHFQPYSMLADHHPLLQTLFDALSKEQRPHWALSKCLELPKGVPPSHPAFEKAIALKKNLEDAIKMDLDIYLASARFEHMEGLFRDKQLLNDQVNQPLDPLDRFLLHPRLCMPIFFVVMFMIFAISIGCSNALEQTIDILSHDVILHGLASLSHGISHPGREILLQAMATALPICLGFYPLIFVFECLIHGLHESGYISRAGLIFEPLTRLLGLRGQVMIPMLVSFACNVNGILSTRSLQDERARISSMMMIPFIPCMARYTLLLIMSQLFFAHEAAVVMFGLYLASIVVAILTGVLIKYMNPQHVLPTVFNDIARLQRPKLSVVISHAAHVSHQFVKRSFLWVFVVCVLFFAMLHSPKGMTDMILPLKRLLSTLLAPIGLADQGPLVLSFVSGIAAKEVMIASLNMLLVHTKQTFFFLPWSSVLHHLSSSFAHALVQLPVYIMHPFKQDGVSVPVGMLQMMSAKQALLYLWLVMITLPCISVFAAIKKELNVKYAMAYSIWSISIGYGSVAVFTAWEIKKVLYLVISVVFLMALRAYSQRRLRHV